MAINGLDYATEFIMTAPGELSNEVERELLEFTNPYAEQIRSVNLFHKDLDSRLRLY